MLKIADPVLKNLAAGTLKQNMPTSFHPDRAEYMHLEALGRTVCGIAPWLELDGLTGEEAEIQAEYRELTRKAIANAVNPESPDFMNFTEGYGQAGRRWWTRRSWRTASFALQSSCSIRWMSRRSGIWWVPCVRRGNSPRL